MAQSVLYLSLCLVATVSSQFNPYFQSEGAGVYRWNGYQWYTPRQSLPMQFTGYFGGGCFPSIFSAPAYGCRYTPAQRAGLRNLLLGLRQRRAFANEDPIALCGDGFREFNGTCYGGVPAGRHDFFFARRYCNFLNGEVVALTSPELHIFLSDEFKFRKYFIGATKGMHGWVWEDGSALEYQNWDRVEPGYVHTCAVADIRMFGKWTATDCKVKIAGGVICQRKFLNELSKETSSSSVLPAHVAPSRGMHPHPAAMATYSEPHSSRPRPQAMPMFHTAPRLSDRHEPHRPPLMHMVAQPLRARAPAHAKQSIPRRRRKFELNGPTPCIDNTKCRWSELCSNNYCTSIMKLQSCTDTKPCPHGWMCTKYDYCVQPNHNPPHLSLDLISSSPASSLEGRTIAVPNLPVAVKMERKRRRLHRAAENSRMDSSSSSSNSRMDESSSSSRMNAMSSHSRMDESSSSSSSRMNAMAGHSRMYGSSGARMDGYSSSSSSSSSSSRMEGMSSSSSSRMEGSSSSSSSTMDSSSSAAMGSSSSRNLRAETLASMLKQNHANKKHFKKLIHGSCRTDADCAGLDEKHRRCNNETGKCVWCLDFEDCAPFEKKCNANTNYCE